MGDLTAEAFAHWLHPTDVIEWYHQRREHDPKGLIATMLRDGLLRAAAGQLIIGNCDLGLALISRDLWERAIHPDLWLTGRFRLQRGGKIISAYDVRIDREVQILPISPPDKAPKTNGPDKKQPLSEARLRAWAELFVATYPTATEAAARKSLDTIFPDNGVPRERLREALPVRKRGRPTSNKS